MLSRIWNKIPQVLKDRPFGIYVSTIVFGLGVYGLTNAEDIAVNGTFMHIIVLLISLYFLIASMIVIASLVVNRYAHPTFAIFGEMYGWLFISAAALSTAILVPIQSVITSTGDGGFIALITFFWATLFVASTVRAIDILVSRRENA